MKVSASGGSGFCEWSGPSIDAVAAAFRALGDPIRLRLLEQLTIRDRTVNDLAQAVRTSQPNASKHLQLLVQAGLVDSCRQGRFVRYSAPNAALLTLLGCARRRVSP